MNSSKTSFRAQWRLFFILSLVCLCCAACPGSKDGANGDKTAGGNGADANAGGEDQMNNEGKVANHLAGEKSLYLQQHMYNPVDWYPWGDEAFKRATDENKLVFLSIGYSSCHWCHVMEEEVFEDQEVADYLNAHFICIKVDREERPDIDSTYMSALQALTGGGGWPLNMFCLPAKKPVTGTTYIPKADFMSLCAKVVDAWDNNREQILDQSEQLSDYVATIPELGEKALVDEALQNEIVDSAVKLFDSTWGGFQGQPKFPVPNRWQYLMHYYRKNGRQDVADMTTKTLDEMKRSGLYDHIGGGFHRYSVDESWTVPHFEKLLYDNAQLASLYIEAGELFDNDEYRWVAKDTLDFMLREMQDPEGGMYSSFDADSDGVEGSYYCFTPQDMLDIAGETDGKALNALFGITDAGNFADYHGKISNVTVLSRRSTPEAVASASGLSNDEVARLYEKYRLPIREFRARRVAPGLDKKIVSSWNGLAISAFASAYMAYGDQRYLDAAKGIADYVIKNHHREDGGLLRASTEHVASGDGVLDDYADMANGLIDIYLAGGGDSYLQQALTLLDYADAHFRHESAAWYSTADYVELPLGRRVEAQDTVEPCGISQMLKANLRAASITGDVKKFELVDSDLQAYHSMLSFFAEDPDSGMRYYSGLDMANWLDVVLLNSGPLYEVVIAGDPADPATGEMLAIARSGARSYVLPMQVAAAGPSEPQLSLQPVLEGKSAFEDKPTGFVCKKGTCNAPTNDPAELQKQLAAGWKH